MKTKEHQLDLRWLEAYRSQDPHFGLERMELHTEKAGGRLCASDYHLGKRQNESYQNSVYRTQNKYSEKSTNKYEKFCPADLPHPAGRTHQIRTIITRV